MGTEEEKQAARKAARKAGAAAKMAAKGQELAAARIARKNEENRQQ
jgi:hypothetical protein